MNPNQKSSERAAEIIRRTDGLAGNRGNEECHWQEIAERVLPMHSKMFNNLGTNATTGEKRNEFIFDSTAAVALNRFAAILDSLLTPRNQTWHRIRPSNPYLAKNRDVSLWFEEVNALCFKYRYAAKANFSSQNQQNYKSLGAYGTGSVFVDELGSEPGLRYRNIHLAEVYFSENHQGIIDQAYRRFKLTARQAVQQFKAGTLPKSIEEMATRNPENKYVFIHCVSPRPDRNKMDKTPLGMEFRSEYVSVTEQKIISEGGYNTWPYPTSRYEQSPGEVYGRSPAMDVLPAIKTLNEQKKTVLKQGQRTVDPVLLAHDDGILDDIDITPGATNYGGVSADGRPLIHTLPVGNIMIGKELMDDERAIINDAFLVKLFQILVETPTMTATEVMERAREKGILLAPTLGRQQSEYLGPMIEREIDILSRQRLLPPMPELLKEARGEYRIEYDSPLSRAQRAEEASGLMRSVEATLNIVNVTQDPAPLDHYDWDVIIPELNEINGVPARWMKSKEMVAQLRESRAEQQAQAAEVQAAPGAAALIKSSAVASKASA